MRKIEVVETSSFELKASETTLLVYLHNGLWQGLLVNETFADTLMAKVVDQQTEMAVVEEAKRLDIPFLSVEQCTEEKALRIVWESAGYRFYDFDSELDKEPELGLIDSMTCDGVTYNREEFLAQHAKLQRELSSARKAWENACRNRHGGERLASG